MEKLSLRVSDSPTIQSLESRWFYGRAGGIDPWWTHKFRLSTLNQQKFNIWPCDSNNKFWKNRFSKMLKLRKRYRQLEIVMQNWYSRWSHGICTNYKQDLPVKWPILTYFRRFGKTTDLEFTLWSWYIVAFLFSWHIPLEF